MPPSSVGRPSYLAKAAVATSPKLSPMEERVLQLQHPPAQSMPLTAALQLLNNKQSSQVFLMDREYLQNWLNWAYAQDMLDETPRLQDALRLAAVQYSVTPPNSASLAEDPGPIDATILSVEGHALLLSPLVQVMPKPSASYSAAAALAFQRSRSVNTPVQSNPGAGVTPVPTATDNILCLAVPEEFYETLRAVHGVTCDDGYTVSFQAPESERLILHHQYKEVSHSPSPIEFRRKMIRQSNESASQATTSSTQQQSLMDKLLAEEQQLRQPTIVVEVHPLKLVYEVDDGKSGFVLVSRESLASEVCLALLRTVVPSKVTSCVRAWIHPMYTAATSADTTTDAAWELVDLQALESERWTIREWIERLGYDKSTSLLVETRQTVNSEWPRHSLELQERIKIGDAVDAQDVAGRWYEAVVTAVDDVSVTVHYLGWASKWNARLKRRRDQPMVDGVLQKVQAPAPLWSRAERWREKIVVGDSLEVRDSSSLADRPKWYKGVVRKVGSPTDPVKELIGGAELETFAFDVDPEKKATLLILQRTQQVLVEVEQENMQKSGQPATSPGEGDLAAGLNPNPPYLRWVNLFGEEICRLGTHLKQDDRKGPVTLRYDYDGNRKPVEVLKSQPGHGAGFLRESLRGTPPAPGSVGLHNLGNSCFLNSTVQCLNHIEPLTQYFLQDKYNADLNRTNPLGSGGNVAVAYASILKKMWSGEFSTLAPRLLKQAVASFAPQFDNSYQHDSQEFCQFLMDGLHEDLNRVKAKPYVEELEAFGMDDQKAAIESWRKHLLRHDSIIVDHCQGMHRSHLTCPRCGRESIKFDVFSSISMPLALTKKRSGLKLEDCLEKFMEGEQLDERNAWYCPNCRQHVCALKMIALWSVPDTLILHLKRFTFDTCMTSGGMLRSKMDDKVEFPIERLDLTKHVLGPTDPNAPPIYKLFGVSEHAGPTANSGHYTATVRNSIDGFWYHCNDSHIGITSGEASITGGAYVLFYQRAKGISKWAGMEKIMVERGINPYGGLETDQEGFKKVKTKSNKSKRRGDGSSHGGGSTTTGGRTVGGENSSKASKSTH